MGFNIHLWFSSNRRPGRCVFLGYTNACADSAECRCVRPSRCGDSAARDESPTVMRWLLHGWGQWTPWTPRPSQGNPSFFGNFFSNFWIAFTVFLSLFLCCCASEGPTPNRKTWPISHWLFVVAGKSWKGVLAISSTSTGCLGRILKWRRRMSDWNSV